MKISNAGIILVTERYEESVAFYGGVLGLALLFRLDRKDSTLACFDLGGAYLMVEPGKPPPDPNLTTGRSPVKLRFNVEDVAATARELQRKGVEIVLGHYDWGSTAEFADPDGNRCALRSVQGFGM